MGKAGNTFVYFVAFFTTRILAHLYLSIDTNREGDCDLKFGEGPSNENIYRRCRKTKKENGPS